MVRRAQAKRGQPGRRVIVAAEHGFHGRTHGRAGADREGVDPRAVRAVRAGRPVRALRRRGRAGRGGRPATAPRSSSSPARARRASCRRPTGTCAAAREACDAAGALLVLDEIQSGIGRTGAWFAHQHDGVLPDVLTLAKGLGGGLPIGACIGLGSAATALDKGDHGSTFGGNPVACAAALAVLDTIEADGLLAPRDRGWARSSRRASRRSSHPLLAGVRGRGLWLAIVLTEPAGRRGRERLPGAPGSWSTRCSRTRSGWRRR